MPELMCSIIGMRLDDQVGMQQNAVLEPHDPRRLSSVLAPIPPPPTREIAERQISRFSASGSSALEDPNRTIDYDYTVNQSL